MTGTRKVFIDRSNIYTLTTGTHANLITLYPMDFMVVHTGIVSGTQTITNHGIELVEETFANIDLVASYGKYCVSASNAIIFAVDGATVNTLEKAGDYVEGMLLNYQLNSTAYVGTIYSCESYLSNGTFIGEVTNLSLSDISARLLVVDNGLNPNTAGYTYHIISRDKTPIL